MTTRINCKLGYYPLDDEMFLAFTVRVRNTGEALEFARKLSSGCDLVLEIPDKDPTDAESR
jgi:hypothetical protein